MSKKTFIWTAFRRISSQLVGELKEREHVTKRLLSYIDYPWPSKYQDGEGEVALKAIRMSGPEVHTDLDPLPHATPPLPL